MEPEPSKPREDVRLSPIEPGHAEAMSRWLSDPEIAGALGVHREVSLEETERWIARALKDDSCWPFAILVGDRHVGNVVLDQLDRYISSARLSIYVGEPNARGAGVGEAAIRLALADAFGRLGLYKVWLIAHNLNEGAIGLYLKCGFVIEGVLRGEFIFRGERIDAVRMGICADRFEPK
jgi:RimJ/RimL family protein N-acetyltransferase